MIKNGFIKVGTSSPRVSVGNPIANVEVMLKALEVAKQKQLGILVFPNYLFLVIRVETYYYRLTYYKMLIVRLNSCLKKIHLMGLSW